MSLQILKLLLKSNEIEDYKLIIFRTLDNRSFLLFILFIKLVSFSVDLFQQQQKIIIIYFIILISLNILK